MASPGEEKDYKTSDPVEAATSTNRDESLDQNSKRDAIDRLSSNDGALNIEKAESFKRPELQTQKSYATSASGTDSNVEALKKGKPWYKNPNPLRWGSVPPVPRERQISREHEAGFWSMITFQWMAPLMDTGYRRPLEMNDIWKVNPTRSADLLTNKLKESFRARVARGDKYPLLFAIHETFKREFWLGGICSLFASIFQVMSPFTLRYLIQFANDAYSARTTPGQAGPHIANGIGLVLGITFMQILGSLGTNQFIYHGMMVGGQSRSVLISIIFEKAMTISGRAKAGGKSTLDQDQEQAEHSTAEAKAKQQSFKDKMMGKSRGTGADQTPDQAKGIAGDGTGWGNGKIINLMSVDTYRIDQASGLFHLIWTAPVACIVTLVVLVINLSYSALAGFALLVIGLPFLTMAVKSLFVRRRGINKITDHRVSMTQEILQSVRFVKYFGWEAAFLERLGDVRAQEIRAIQVLLAIRNGINAISMSLPVFSSAISFITYSLTDHALNPASVFSSLALFNSLRMPLNLLPLVIGQVVDAWSSTKRIQEYLLCEDQDDEAKWVYDAEYAIEMEHSSFTWERTPTQDADSPKGYQSKDQAKQLKNQNQRIAKDEKAAELASSKMPGDGTPDSASTLAEDRPPFKLQDLSLSIGRGDLIAVIGGVGSGKSSFLAALAGDMRRTSGDITLGADRAFCPQYAWIQNATVRDNILFGKEMDKKWYDQVIDACCLRPDFDILPAGDDTEIGERGITVSGGQKQRINIARAIYFDADIILMDDPLSAVDAHVGRAIFDNAICGLLGNKCRILATHQLWVLNRVDRVIWLDDGRIRAIDTFNNLMATNPGFQDVMKSTTVGEENEQGEEVEPVEDKKDPAKKKKKRQLGLMQAEERAVDSVPWSVYGAYIRASGSIFNFIVVIFLLILSQGGNIVTSLWLSWWTSDKFGYDRGTYIGVYAGLGTMQSLAMFLFSLALTIFGTRSSKVMLSRAITRVLRAPMSFFDTTPLGRITNRFSRDVDVMDNNLTDAIRMYFLTLAMIISVFILTITYFHYFAVALGPLLIIFIASAAYYRASAREMKRFESVLRSGVFAKFSEGLSGTACVRAYGLQKRFINHIRDAIDEMDSALFLTFSNQRWLSVRLDAIGNLLVFITGMLVVTSRFDVGPAVSGLVLSYLISIVGIMQFSVRQLAEVENGMNATERLHYYGTSLEEEAPAHTIDIRPSWPESGEIIFDNVQMRYRENLPLVLQGLSMHVKGGERIGVVGRTGAGKSSIMSTLFRLVELSGGSITIDGEDISKLGLHDLRSRLAIIPQDPTLFRGTIRSNLDPFNEHTDLELWSALRQADLVTSEQTLEDKSPGRIHLDGTVEEEGLNFSLGQRQLMALARALVRGSQIIVCDEATSSVDMETDEKIQKTIQEGFKGKTLLCIAHRLKTIINYDRICVMNEGRIEELDRPSVLFERGGIFRGMCEKSGIRRSDFAD